MIKIILFDCDGLVIHREMYFSRRLIAEHIHIKPERILPFFEGPFQACLVGRADLKIELGKVIRNWGYKGTAPGLMDYWFRHEADVDRALIDYIDHLRSQNIKCYLATDNEKYRVSYLLDDVGLRKHFDGYFASCDLGFKKIQPRFWKIIHGRISNVDPLDVLVWDDDERNVQAARSFGFNAEFYKDFGSFKQTITEYRHRI